MISEVELSLGGEKRTLKFGITQTAKYCEINGDLPLAEYWAHMATLGDGTLTAKTLIDLIYSAVWAGGNKEVERDLIGDWIDTSEEGLSDILLVVSQALIKTAPKTTEDKKKQKATP